jgi:hypothetical protein
MAERRRSRWRSRNRSWLFALLIRRRVAVARQTRNMLLLVRIILRRTVRVPTTALLVSLWRWRVLLWLICLTQAACSSRATSKICNRTAIMVQRWRASSASAATLKEACFYVTLRVVGVPSHRGLLLLNLRVQLSSESCLLLPLVSTHHTMLIADCCCYCCCYCFCC